MPTILTLLMLPKLCVMQATPALPADSLGDLYHSGQPWETFYAATDRRRDLWVETWTQSQVPDDLLARARATGGPWRILVITEPGCSDSANSVPYLARLVALTPGLDMRLVSSAAGRAWMERYRTPDGRAATPTVLLLDEHYTIRGVWVEQPAALQAIWLPLIASGNTGREFNRKMEWYIEDAGQELLREWVEMLEQAASQREP